MAHRYDTQLSRRERQIMEIVYRLGRASVAEVIAAMPDASSYSAVRTIINLLEEKGHLRHAEEGRKYVYSPTMTRDKARRSALQSLLQTFFEGSVEQAVSSLLNLHQDRLSGNDLDRLTHLIERAKKEKD
jgi:BlaI family transcriptional regulator, penicillinase repressor